MKNITNLDQILLAIYEQVASFTDPADHPVTVTSVSVYAMLSVEQVLFLLPFLCENGFLRCSPISDPPLLYLTQSGLARARRKGCATY